jgi:hypothetical protein
MIRNLKVLGLALVAMLALTAVAASVASAQQGKLTSDGSFTLKGEETGVEANFLEAFGLKVQCPGSTYTGHKLGSTTELITSGSTTGTLTPQYKQANHNCNVTPGNFKATIDMNGCDYVAHLGVTTGGVAGTYGVTFDVVCPNEQTSITVTVWTTSALETSEPNNPMCKLHVRGAPFNQGLKGAHATDSGAGDITLTGTVEGINVQKTKTTHSLLCPTAESNTGKFGLDVTVKGLNGAGGATNISISE